MNLKDFADSLQPDMSDVTPYDVKLLRNFISKQYTKGARELKYLQNRGFIAEVRTENGTQLVTTYKGKKVLETNVRTS